jgi:hypothetical protein
MAVVRVEEVLQAEVSNREQQTAAERIANFIRERPSKTETRSAIDTALQSATGTAGEAPGVVWRWIQRGAWPGCE